MIEVTFAPTLTNEAQRKKVCSGIYKNALTIGTKKLAWVPVEVMNIKPYQRNKSAHVLSIAENWDESLCKVLRVSYDEKEGCFNVVDGQHRAAAARIAGVEYLVCEIYSGLTMSNEAALFVRQNENSKPLSTYDTFRANQFVLGDDETELSMIDKRIYKICEDFGIVVKNSGAVGTLRTISAARDIVKRSGDDGLRYVFSVIRDSKWHEMKDAYVGSVVSAIGRIYINKDIDPVVAKDRLCGFLQTSSPNELIALANSTYPNFTRTVRMHAIFDDIIADPVTGKADQETAA